MPQPPAAPPSSKKKRQRLIIIGAAGAALLLLLYIRSRSASSSTNATSATDVQAAAAQQAALDAQNAASSGATPSTFADNGANAGALSDSVTTGLGNVATALQDLQASQASSVPATAGDVPAAAVAPTASPAITFNISNGQPAGTSPAGTGSRATTPATGMSALAKALTAKLQTPGGMRLDQGGSAILTQIKNQGYRNTTGGTWVKGGQKYFVFGKGNNRAIRQAK